MSLSCFLHFSSPAALGHPFATVYKRLFPIGAAILPCMAMGCAQGVPLWEAPAPVPVVRAAGADPSEVVLSRPVVRTSATESLPAPAPLPGRSLPISLDTVFRLAEEQNVQIALARARVDEASAEKGIAAKGWLPRVDVGTAYYRHEGGIANEDGTLTHSSFGTFFGGVELNGRLDLREAVYQKVNAERLLWQQRGELRRITSETLLDAASTYVDLLAARTGEAIANSMQKDLHDLLVRAQKLAGTEPGAKVEVARIEAQLKGRDQLVLEMHEQAARASVKLAYLLGLDPALPLLAADAELVPLELVDVTPPVADLVARALSTGPGIQEMEGLLALIHDSIERSRGPGRLLPVFEVYMGEGIFAAGPGARSDWDNRWDLGVAARWNLTEHLTRCERERLLRAKTEQAHLAYLDLRSKLTAGVYEAREAILSGRDQIHATQEQITQAKRAHKLSDDRLKNNISGSSPSEVLLSLQALSLAQASYLNVLRAYDKAELRLLLLLGPSSDCPTPVGSEQ
ncbi:MAG TPA: TolC family protein [Gemmataceae bacterium]|nr:TolC family protein [Gemmataceae bacterium]